MEIDLNQNIPSDAFDTIYHDDSLRVYSMVYFTPDGDGINDYFSIVLINYKSKSYTKFKSIYISISDNCRTLYQTSNIFYPSREYEYSAFESVSTIWEGKGCREGGYIATIHAILPNLEILDKTIRFELHRRRD